MSHDVLHSADGDEADVTAASDTTIPSFSRLSAQNLHGNSGCHQVTNPVAALRRVGAVRRAVIIVNDLAPGARDAHWRELFASTLGEDVELTEVRVRHFEGAFQAARGAAAWGAELVIAVGGDGTVNAIVNGLGEAGTRLAVVPAGTANDLAHLLGQAGIPSQDAIGMQSWERKDIDAIEVNGYRFFTAGGLGWVADVAATANRWRAGSRLRRWVLSLLGHVIYPLACVAVIFGKRRLGGQLTIDYTDATDGRDKRLEVDACGMIVASSAKVGSDFALAPVSRMDDGIFELIVFPRTSRRRLLATVLAAKRGKLFEQPEMRWIQVRRAEVQSNRVLRFFGDGEILEHADHFSIGITSAGVKLMAPAVTATEPVTDLSTALALARS
jgi:diacylglycerol kinase (ATP)